MFVTWLAALIALPAVASARAYQHVVFGSSCPDVMFVAARGSGEAPQGKGWDSPQSYKNKDIQYGAGGVVYPLYLRLVAASRLKISLDPVIYRATSVPELFHKPGDFLGSVTDGANAIVSELKRIEGSCHGKVKYLLAGYSQGAWVIHRALHKLAPTTLKQVVGVVLFGDPLFVPYQGIVRQNKLLDVSSGLAAGVDPFNTNVPKQVRGFSGSWCAPLDDVCQSTPSNATLMATTCITLLTDACPHYRYVKDGYVDNAVTFLIPHLPKPPKPPFARYAGSWYRHEPTSRSTPGDVAM